MEKEARRKRRTWIVGVVVVVLALRELGVLSLDLYRAESSAQYTTVRPKATEGDPFNLAVSYRDGTPEENEAGSDSIAHLTAWIERMDFSGADRMPIVKSGACEFEIVLATDAGREVGSVEGTITQSAFGFCSTHTFRANMVEQAKSIASDAARPDPDAAAATDD